MPIPLSDVSVCVCVCVIVKCPVLPPCVADGHSRNPLYYYYYYLCVWKRVKGGSKESLEVAMLCVCVEEGQWG